MNDTPRKLLIVEDDPGLQSQLKWCFEDYEGSAAALESSPVGARHAGDDCGDSPAATESSAVDPKTNIQGARIAGDTHGDSPALRAPAALA